MIGLTLSAAVHGVALAMIRVEPLEWGTRSPTQSVMAIELPALRAVDLEPLRTPPREVREEGDPGVIIRPIETPRPEVPPVELPSLPTLALTRTPAAVITDSVPARLAATVPVLDSGERGEYEQQVTRWVERQREYPLAARHRRIEGTAIVRIQVDGDGSLLAALLVRDTGYAVLDRAALEMIERAAPYPRVPRSLASSPVEVLVPIQFTLSR